MADKPGTTYTVSWRLFDPWRGVPVEGEGEIPRPETPKAGSLRVQLEDLETFIRILAPQLPTRITIEL